MTATLAAEPKLTQQELEQGRLFIEQTRNSVVGATKGLTDAQWCFKPAPDHWSIVENLDHIVIVQERVLGPVLSQLADAPPPPAGQDARLVDAITIHQIPTRLNRYPAPEFVHPVDELSPRVLLGRFEANCRRMADSLESIPELRLHALPSPPLKVISNGAYEVMDGYQWILAAAAHTERHVKQMLEVMAGASYPE